MISLGDEIIYVTEAGDVLLRLVKISPSIKNKKFSYGGVKFEVLKVKKLNDDEEEYELIAECLLDIEASALIGSILSSIAIECLNDMRNIVAFLSMMPDESEKCSSNKAYS